MFPDDLPTLPTGPDPSVVEVAVIGAGIAGLAVAGALASRGVRVGLFEAERRLGGGGSWRGPGLLTPGLPEPIWRLVHAIGQARTRDLLSLGAEGLRQLAELGVSTQGLTHGALSPREASDLEKSADALHDLQIPATVLTADQARAALGAEHLVAGLSTPIDRSFSVSALAQALLRAALDAGVSLHGGARVSRLGQQGGDHAIFIDGWPAPVRAHLTILCAGHASTALEPWLTDKLIPVREHSLQLAGGPGAPSAGQAQLGYVSWAPEPDGSLILSGCRWATPHMEIFEDDPTVTVPRILDKLRHFLARHFPDCDPKERGCWARIDTHSCDNLPIIGPLPGDPTRVICAGFQGNAPALALAAAQGLAAALTEGPTDLPDWLGPGRFL